MVFYLTKMIKYDINISTLKERMPVMLKDIWFYIYETDTDNVDAGFDMDPPCEDGT